MLCEIEKIVKLFKECPQYKGKIYVDTPFGKKRIIHAFLVEKQSDVFVLQTKDRKSVV